MTFKIFVLICFFAAVAHLQIEAADVREPEIQRFKRQQPFQPVVSLLSEPLNKASQAGANPLSLLQNGAAQAAKNLPQPLRFKRHIQPVFSLLGDHINRVAKALDSLTGLDSSSSTTTTTTTTEKSTS